MNSLMEQLHDIEGLDPISWWPLALGWWVAIAFGVIVLCVIVFLIIWRIAFKRSWKNDTLQKLSRLEKNLTDANARDTLMDLSEYLRRIALKRFSRKECAGLTGESWLKWLSERDPKEFDWKAKGMLLVEIPYAPQDTSLSANQIKELIQATRHWVR